MTAAERVIKAFGGVSALSKALGIRRDCVYRWTYSKERRGSDGVVPARWHGKILEAAKERGIPLEKGDLVNV